jgi:hypothetical protein
MATGGDPFLTRLGDPARPDDRAAGRGSGRAGLLHTRNTLGGRRDRLDHLRGRGSSRERSPPGDLSAGLPARGHVTPRGRLRTPPSPCPPASWCHRPGGHGDWRMGDSNVASDCYSSSPTRAGSLNRTVTPHGFSSRCRAPAIRRSATCIVHTDLPSRSRCAARSRQSRASQRRLEGVEPDSIQLARLLAPSVRPDEVSELSVRDGELDGLFTTLEVVDRRAQ